MFDLSAFRACEAYFSQPHAESFELLHGTGAVMLSAPHSAAQTRNGRVKVFEPQTGALARLLHQTLGCPVIYKTRNCGDDANYDYDSPYKRALCDYVKQNGILLLLDLHQLAPHRDVMIDVGTGKRKHVVRQDLLDETVRAFSSRLSGTVALDVPFNASSPRTVSSCVFSECGITALQIEINSSLVWSSGGDASPQIVFDALAEIVQRISNNQRDGAV